MRVFSFDRGQSVGRWAAGLAAALLLAQIAIAAWKPEDGLIIVGDLVTMDAGRGVVPDGQLVIVGEKIAAVLNQGESLPADLQLPRAVTIETDGWVFPGLIDAHNHVEYNVLPLWEAPKKYTNRYQWPREKRYEKEIKYPKRLLTDGRYYNLRAECIKYAEVKAIVGGVTSIQGTPNLKATRLLVRNIENYNFGQDRISQTVFAVTDARVQEQIKDNILPAMAANKLDAWIMHLGEGAPGDQTCREEFEAMKAVGILEDWTVAIHCSGFDADHFRQMAEKGTKMVWSPTSNMLLYGATADIRAADEAEVVICLGADWSPSGMKNLLGELKMAHEIDERHFDALSEEDLVRMVTVNPAFALGLDDKIGQLRPGLYADVAVFAKVDEQPYRSLVRCTEKHVVLVLVGGDPVYGDRRHLERLKPGDYEVLVAGGVEKAIDVTRPDLPKGEQTFVEIKTLLEQAVRFDTGQMWQAFGNGLDLESFEEELAHDFELGISPARLDPIFAYDDARFFEALRSSTVADFGFDPEKYWRADDPDAALLAFVNSAEATVFVLDVDVALDRRAAENIVAERDGADGQYGTADDQRFESVARLLEVRYVGNSALRKLRDYVSRREQSPDDAAVGDAVVLAFVNRATTNHQVLDEQIGLRSNAASSIIEYRVGLDGQLGTGDDIRIDSIEELDQIPNVGPDTIAKIRAYVQSH